jgi:hypothetical protein
MAAINPRRAVMATVDDFRKWYERDLNRYGRWASHVEVQEDTETTLRIWIYTDTNRYHISAHNPEMKKYPVENALVFRVKVSIEQFEALMSDQTKLVTLGPDGYYTVQEAEYRPGPGYLGCTASTRKPRAGEDWPRGNDLADGPLSEETWHSILADIVGYELVRVHRRQQPPADGIQATGGPETGSVPLAPIPGLISL